MREDIADAYVVLSEIENGRSVLDFCVKRGLSALGFSMWIRMG